MGSFDSYFKAKLAAATPEERQLDDALAAYYEALYDDSFGLGEQIAQARAQARLTQDALASVSGVPQPEISRIEHGQANPTLETLTKLLRPLGLHLSAVAVEGFRADRAATEAT